jgi:hypothetical protein
MQHGLTMMHHDRSAAGRFSNGLWGEAAAEVLAFEQYGLGFVVKS